MAKVLIFGATGEIGSRIANLSCKAKHQVYGVTRGQNQRVTAGLEGVEFFYGDKNDLDFLKKLAETVNPEVIIDTVPAQKNVDLYMAAFPKVKNVFFCSSTGTFVPLQYFPADEKHPWRQDTGVNFFYQCERDSYALEQCKQGKFPITIFRPSNIIGADRIPLELWGGRNIEFFRKLKKSEPIFLPENYENILLQSGYNWDLASAFVLALDHLDEIRGEIFIISCKKAITLKRYLEVAMEYLNSKSELIPLPIPELLEKVPGISMHFGLDFLMLHMGLDISKAEKILNYRPSKTAEDGLKIALQSCIDRNLL